MSLMSPTMHPPHQRVPSHLAEESERPEHENENECGAERHFAKHGNGLAVPRLREWDVRLDENVENRHGECDAENGSPGPCGAADYESDHREKGDVDSKVAGIEEAFHHAEHSAQEPHD